MRQNATKNTIVIGAFAPIHPASVHTARSDWSQSGRVFLWPSRKSYGEDIQDRGPGIFQRVPLYGTARSAISVTAVRANELPRVVSCADALPLRVISISMPSRPRSATVTPETGLTWVLADDALQAPSRL
jgi:hypothetical protein